MYIELVPCKSTNMREIGIDKYANAMTSTVYIIYKKKLVAIEFSTSRKPECSTSRTFIKLITCAYKKASQKKATRSGKYSVRLVAREENSCGYADLTNKCYCLQKEKKRKISKKQLLL